MESYYRRNGIAVKRQKREIAFVTLLRYGMKAARVTAEIYCAKY